MSSKILYVPVEIKVREFHAKILLAAEAARRGYDVVLGRKAEVMDLVRRWPNGVFMGLWAQENFLSFYKDLKARGFLSVVMDEEGLVTFSDEMYKNFKLCPRTLAEIDAFMTWGDYQARVVRTCEAKPEPEIVSTGSVRIDVLRPEFSSILDRDVAAIKQEYNKTILIISSFGLANHYDSVETYFESLRKNLIIRNDEDEAFLWAYTALQKDAFEGLVDAVPLLAKAFPDHTIILRPHPSENHKPWQNIADKHENVVVRGDGNIHAWLMACDVMVHHFCTTSLEAYVAGVPAIAFRPRKDETLETNLPYWSSLEAMTPDVLLEKVKAIIAGDVTEVQAVREAAKPVLAGYMHEPVGGASCDVMLDVIDRLSKGRTFGCLDDGILRKEAFVSNFKDFARRLKRRIMRQSVNYIDHKFSELSEVEIKEGLKALAKQRPEYASLKLRQVNKFTYVISQG